MADAPERELIRIAETFAEVTRSLMSRHGVQETLEQIVDLAVDSVESCEFAGIAYVEGRNITSPASSKDIAHVVDTIQRDVDEGPCLDAIREHEDFQTGDLAAEARWPQFSTRAHGETGVTSVLALRLFVEQDTMGALNLYSTRRDAFDDSDVALATVFATHAAAAMAAARREEQLERKATSREAIGRAKGVLMARQNISDEQAFAILKRASQRLNVKLVEVAEGIARTGDEALEPPR